MTTVAVVGLGYWGKNLIRVFSGLTSVKTCVHTGTTENADWLEKNYPDISLTTEYDVVLSDGDIDAVVIATPIETHYELTRRALKTNNHVFIEKPLASRISDAREITRLANHRESSVFVGYILNHHPTMQPLLKYADQKKVAWGRFNWERFGEFKETLLLDIISHPIAVAYDLFGVKPSESRVLTQKSVSGGTDIMYIRLIFPSGGTFDIDVNRISTTSNKSLHVAFEDGTLYQWSEDSLKKFSSSEKIYETYMTNDTEPLLFECRRFLSEIQDREPPSTDASFGLSVNEIIDEIEQSETVE